MKLILVSLALLCMIGVAQAQPATTTVPGTLLTAPSASGMIYNSAGASHIWGATTTPTLGAAGVLGSMTFGNTTSGLATIEPATGALGTTVVLIPALNTTDTITTNGATQTLVGKTLTSPTINGGALSGTFTGAPTLSGNLIFSGNPSFTGAPTFSTPLSVANGGTSQNTLGANDVLIGNGTSGIISSTITYSSGAFTTPSAGAYWVNSSSNGLYFPNVAPTAGAGCNSLVGIKEGGSNIACSNPPALILDLSLDQSNYKSGRTFLTGDSNTAINGDFITLASHDDQTQPSATAQSIGFGGTWANGDIASISVAFTGPSGGSPVTVLCTVGTTCNGTWGSGATPAVVCGYFAHQLSTGVNATLTAAQFYSHGSAACTANYPSSGFTGFPFLISAYYTGTITLTNGSVTGSGTVSVYNGSNLLDGPVGLIISRTRPSSSSRAPQASDNIGSITFAAPTTTFPNLPGAPGPNNTGGFPYADLVATIVDPTDASLRGRLDIFTACATDNQCARFGIGQGAFIYDAGSDFTDDGPGTLSFPATGAAYWGTVKTLDFTGGTTLQVLTPTEFTGLSTATLNNYLCFSTADGHIATDTTCGTSAKRFKQPLGEISEAEALRAVDRLPSTPHVWKFNQPGGDDTKIHVGLYAEDAEALDPRCAIYEDGKLKNYEDRCVIDYLSVAVRAQQSEIASLRQALNALTTRVKKVR